MRIYSAGRLILLVDFKCKVSLYSSKDSTTGVVDYHVTVVLSGQ